MSTVPVHIYTILVTNITVYYSVLQYTTVYINSFHQVIDSVMALRNRCCAEEETKHKHDFDWLLEAITKVTI